MAMALRVVGGLLMVYAALYLAQFLFNTLYDNPQLVWDVMNYVSALAILIALVANLAHMRSQSGGGEPLDLARLGAHVLFYANAVLAIWFFRNWIYLLALDEGASARVPVDVIWDFVAVMIPLSSLPPAAGFGRGACSAMRRTVTPLDRLQPSRSGPQLSPLRSGTLDHSDRMPG